MQNRTLNESRTNGVDVFLFEVFTTKQYTFMGQVDLVGDPYQERQADDQGSIRNVWMFPLKVRDGKPTVPVPEEILEREQARRERVARQLSDQALLERAKLAQGVSGTREATTTTYQRNPDVAMWAKRRASGICQLCLNPAPFIDKNGDPYLESHHVIWLSKDGPDTIENTVALCPNCHRKMHILNLQEDVHTLKNKARQRE
jgi:5-methylcytosine-specific restriction protein A